jgi:hypothetical protein
VSVTSDAAGRDGGLQLVADGAGLVEVAPDRQHVAAVGAHHPPLAAHLVDGQVAAEVAPQPVEGPGDRERLARDHAPADDGQPQPVHVHGGRREQQAGEQPDPQGRPDRARRERPLQPPPAEADGARGGGVDAADAVEGRRLAGPVGADERDDGPFGHVEVEAGDGHEPAEPHRQLLDGQQRRAAHQGRLPVRGSGFPVGHPCTSCSSAAIRREGTSPSGR